MQITVKEAKVVKTGTNKSGEWELIRVTSEDNTEYTTFDKKAKTLTGATIEFEPIIKEGKLSFKEFKLISEGQVSLLPAAKAEGMTPEAWAEKDRLERFSIESQVAFKGIIELAKQPIADDTQTLEVYRAALDWAMAHFKPVQTTTKAPEKLKAQAKVISEEVEFDSSPIENLGALWTRCKNYDISKAEGLELLELTDQSQIVDLDEAWKTIFNRKFKRGAK